MTNQLINSMNVIVGEDYDKMSKKAANIIAAQMHLNARSVLGLATGGTPVGMYAELVKKFEEDELDFSQISSFNLDEYYPIKRSNNQSYYYFMNEQLFKHVNIPKDAIHIPNGEAENIALECETYDRMIEEAGGIDIQVLGIGPNGHIGFNEPDDTFETSTHFVKLDQHTIEANSRFFDSIDEVPTQAITMGIKSIMKAKKILLLASGEGKAQVIYDMLNGPIDPKLPASVLQLHPDVTVVLDKGAAKLL